jgi:hypothetical protein
MKDEQRYAVQIADTLKQMFDEDSEIHAFDLEEIDATKYFTGMVLASCLIFNDLTGRKMDLIDFTHVQNKLVIQYIMDKKEE